MVERQMTCTSTPSWTKTLVSVSIINENAQTVRQVVSQMKMKEEKKKGAYSGLLICLGFISSYTPPKGLGQLKCVFVSFPFPLWL